MNLSSVQRRSLETNVTALNDGVRCNLTAPSVSSEGERSRRRGGSSMKVGLRIN